MTDWIAQARARCDAATPGPWELRSQGVDMSGRHPWTLRTEGVPGIRVYLRAEQVDAEFIAAARTDLSRALDALERVQEFLAEYVSPVDVVDEDSFNHGVDRAVAMVRAALDGDA